MSHLYNLSIIIYGVLVRAASIFNPKAGQFVRGRRDWLPALRRKVDPTAQYLWFHCSSLGEFEQGRPLIEEIKAGFPQYRILLTFFSPSGYEIRKNYSGADVVCYLPLDTPTNAHKFIETVKPVKAFFIKYEFWRNYISELNRRTIPLYLVSGIFRDEQLFFSPMPWGRWHRQVLQGFSHLFVQDENSARLLKSININKLTISGDTRFDRVIKIATGAKNLPIVDKFMGSQRVLVAGSTWKPDEELIMPLLDKHPGLKCIIAPHEVHEGNINRLQQLFITRAVRLSQAEEATVGTYQVLLVDSIGLLSSLYRYGSMAYIGGGFGVGIHNILEAATFGLPVVFGPNYKKFREACELIGLGGAYPVKHFTELDALVSLMINNPSRLKESGNIASTFVRNNSGATISIIRKVFG